MLIVRCYWLGLNPVISSSLNSQTVCIGEEREGNITSSKPLSHNARSNYSGDKEKRSASTR